MRDPVYRGFWLKNTDVQNSYLLFVSCFRFRVSFRFVVCRLLLEPTLFSGTVRSNLDPDSVPGDAAEDAKLWSALGKCSMRRKVSQMGGLDAPVAEFGSNLSGGERQLLCLARTILRKPKVLLLDEATAAVDYETDALIQRTIRTEFEGVTTFVIAHRLSTVMDSDSVLLLDKGCLVEHGKPSELLAKRGSAFARMARQDGLELAVA